MNELETFHSQRIYWAVEQVERVAGDIDDLHLDDNSFYIKSEADEVIRHQKYKRCITLAKWCKYWANYRECCEPPDCSLFIAKAKYYRKWLNRWIKIAEQFKED